MRKTSVFAVIVGSLLAAVGWGQGLPDQLNFGRSNTEGFHLYGATAYYAYSSYSILPRPVVTTQTSSSQYGAGTTLGWQHFRGKVNAAVRYSLNYNGIVQDSSFNRFNQSLVFDVNRAFGAKWSITLSGNAQDLSLSQSMFEPSTVGALSMSSGSFNDLSAAMSVGQFSSGQSAVMMGGSTTAFSPTLTVLLGSRVLSYGAHLNANYEHSSRLSFQFGSFAVGGKNRSDNYAGVVNNYVLPKTIGGTASVGISYSLSPRTNLGVGASQTYTRSDYQKATSTNAYASLGRKMSKNWFMTVNGGGSFTRNLDQPSGQAPNRQMTWGASLGYRTQSHTFIGRYARSGYDPFSAVLGSNSNYSAAWSWRPVRSNWSVHSNYNRNDTHNTGFTTFGGWHVRTGVSRTLSRQMTLLVEGSYLNSHSVYQANNNKVKVYAIRVSLGWTPGLMHRSSSAPVEDEEVK
jgi:hypothetical protein